MPAQVTALSTPEEIEKNADEFGEVLRKTSLPFNRTKVVEDMKRRAAQLQSPPMTVTEWEQMWVAKSAAPPAPATTVEEKPGPPKAKPKKDRGVVVEIDPNYFFVTAENSAHANSWVDINRGGYRMHMLLTGPAGCGKTSLFSEIGRKFELPVYKVDAAAVTTIDRWLGHKDIRITERGPETTYVMSEFLRWVSADGYEPGIVVVDEITRTPPVVSNILMSILDGSESVWVPELGIRVNVHKDVMFGATANIGVGFSGTYALDQALRDRFGMTLKVSWPEAKEEAIILQKRTGVDAAAAERLVAIATQMRLKAAEGEIAEPLSTRALLNTSLLVAKGRTIIDAAEAVFVQHYSEEGGTQSEQMKVKLILQGLAGR